MSAETRDGRATDYDDIDWNWTPIGDWVIVEPDPPEEMINGLFLAPDARQDKRTGTVMTIGEGRWNPFTAQFEAVQVKAGDRVLFGEYSGTPVIVAGKEYKHMKISEIIAFKKQSKQQG